MRTRCVPQPRGIASTTSEAWTRWDEVACMPFWWRWGGGTKQPIDSVVELSSPSTLNVFCLDRGAVNGMEQTGSAAAHLESDVHGYHAGRERFA